MNKQIFALCCFVFSLNFAFNNSNAFSQKLSTSIGAGYLYHSYQDARSSDLIFNRSSAYPEVTFAFDKAKYKSELVAFMYVFQNTFADLDTIVYTTIGYNIRANVIRDIHPNTKIGLNWDILDYWKRSTPILGNNADSYRLSSDLYISLQYNKNINHKFDFNAQLQYGLVSFTNFSPSYTANIQQNLINNGEVGFYEDETRGPFILKNMEFRGFWNQVFIRSNCGITYKKKVTIFYQWHMQYINDIKEYPFTTAIHQLGIRYHFNIIDKN